MGSIASGIGSVAGGIGNVLGSFGGVTNNMAKGFTPQNEFQASNPMDPQMFIDAIRQSQGNLNGLQSQQQNLAAALQAQAGGQGPNPAQAMLNQATDQNIKQNTGMIASQKGINPALAARLSGENAAMMNQHAAGQGAVMGAQQQLAAQNQLGSLYGNMAGQNLNNIAGSANAVNGSVNPTNQINAGTSAQNAAANQSTAGGLLGGIGSMVGFKMAHGGYVPHFADGGKVDQFGQNGGYFPGMAASQQIAAQMAAQAGVPVYASGMKFPDNSSSMPGGEKLPGTSMAGGPMDSLGLPGMEELGGSVGPAMMVANQGAVVPGRAEVAGDAEQNDTVPAMLSPGEVVIPRSVMNAPDSPEKAKEFIEHLKKQKSKKDISYGNVLEAHRKMQEGMEMLQRCMGGKV